MAINEAPPERTYYLPRRVALRPDGTPDEESGSWIQKTSEVCGGDACVRNTRHTVWGLVEWRTLGLTDAAILERHPDLTRADLDAAWSYYAANRDEIDRAIRENEGA
jgi:uncharacterized protein (DUF433 family)